MASAIKSIIGIKCPKCEFVMKTYRPRKAGVFKVVCPKCKKPIYVKIPNLQGVMVESREEYAAKHPAAVDPVEPIDPVEPVDPA